MNDVMLHNPERAQLLRDGHGVAHIEFLDDDETAESLGQFIVTACNAHEDLLAALKICERAMMQARFDSVKVDDSNGDRLNHLHHKVFPCNGAVVNATQDAINQARAVIIKVEGKR